ncbi:MAG: DUF2378 family protein [Candidatus Omnitrophota bacterium]
MQSMLKGIFFNIFLNYLRKNNYEQVIENFSQITGKSLKYVDFFDYSIEEYIILMEEMAKQIFPDKTKEAAYYELGKITAIAVLNTSMAKVGIAYAKRNIRGALKNLPFYFYQFAKMKEVSVKQLDQNRYKIMFKGWPIYPDSEHGLFNFIVKQLDPKINLKFEVISLENLGHGKIRTDFSFTVELPESKE